MDIGLHTELHLSDLERAAAPSADAIKYARDLIDLPPRQLDSLRVYSALADLEEDGTLAVDLWILPFDAAEGGGTLMLAIDPDGHVMRSRVRDNKTTASESKASWEVFWSQFEYDNSRSTISPERALSTVEVGSYRDTLYADTSGVAALTRLMYEHRLIMYDHSHFLRRATAGSAGDRLSSPDWVEEFRETYRRMAEIADELRPVIGDSASAQYARVVDDGAAVLALVAESAAAGQTDAVRDQALSFRRRTCGACHGIENHTAGSGKLKASLFGRLDELGVRRDLYDAGLDVWAVPEDISGSQAMADAVKAVLVVAGWQ